jgi:hypothetical protein
LHSFAITVCKFNTSGRCWRRSICCCWQHSRVSGTYLPPNLPKRPAVSGRSYFTFAGCAGASGAAVAVTLTAGARLRQLETVVLALRHERAGTAARCCMLVSATMLRLLSCAVEG